MKFSVIAISILATACTITGVESHPSPDGNNAGSNVGSGGGGGGDLYKLTVDHSVAAEAALHGVDSDGQGNLWVAYATDGNYMMNVKPVVTLVHWNPISGEHLATYTYNDLFSPVSGMAVVSGQIWMSYEDVAYGDAVTRVIDPTDGSIVRTLGTTAIDLAAMSVDRVLFSPGQDQVLVAQSSTGGVMQTIATTFYLGTQQGVAWRPGEIWAGGWQSPIEVYDEAGTLLGTIDLPALISDSADPVRYLAFDNDDLLVGDAGQLTWYAITP
ncbi:MAG TPA: hypothetical protein VGG28_27550 [Kofleriaceae bacterium]|jgi:hypothetical protein